MTRPTPVETWNLIARWWDGIANTIERNGLDGLKEAEAEASEARRMANVAQTAWGKT